MQDAWAAGTTLGELSPDATHVWGSAESWDPLWLLPAEAAAAAQQRYGLLVERPVLLAEGLWNKSWRVSSRSETFVLRVIRPDLDLGQVSYEHGTTARLHERVPEVVVALPGLDGLTVQRWGDMLITLFPFIVGATAATGHPSLWEPWAAQMLGRIHQAGMAAGIGQRPGAMRVDEQPTIWSTIGPVLWEQLDQTEETLALLRGMDAEAAALDSWLTEAIARRPLTIGTVHGDFNARNLLVDDERIVAVLDWETVQRDALLTDLADVLVVADRPPDYWRSYREAGGPVEEWELRLLPALARRQSLLELQFAVDELGRAKPQALRKLREVTATLSALPALDDPDWTFHD